MVLDKIRQGMRPENAVITQLRAHQWRSDGERKSLLDKLQAMPEVTAEDVAWTAIDPTPELRSVGLALLKKQPRAEALAALVPHLRTRSEAARRAVQRFIQELAGDGLGPFLLELTTTGDDFARLAVLELAKNVPPDTMLSIFRKVLQDPNPQLRAKALRLVSDGTIATTPQVASTLALPRLKDDNEEIRLAALGVLERHPNEALITPILNLARGGGRVSEAAFAALRKLMPVSQKDQSGEVLPLLADGNSSVRNGAVSLLLNIPAPVLARRFVEIFCDSFVWVRDRALDTIGKGMPAFVPALLAQTQDPDPKIARGALEMALILQDVRAVPIWLHLAKDQDSFIRHQALERLGQHGGGQPGVLERVTELLADPDVLLSAVSALAQFKDPRTLSPLYRTFGTLMDHPEDQIEILEAMATVGGKDPRVVQVFTTIAGNTTVSEKVRERARNLVGNLQGDAARDAIPRVTAAPKVVDFSSIAEPRLVDFLADTVARGGSDFHLATGFVPHRRIFGELEAYDVPPVTRKQAEDLIKGILEPEEYQNLQKDRQLDICIKIPGLGRFRANFYSQRQGFDAAFRVIPAEVPTLVDVGLPESMWEVTRFTQGLVLVTGPAGCGKSTTLAALLNRVNETRKGHIITVEDPVEFVHPNKECLVNQRQVPHHTASFARALKAALREDPDVILIGEMRDLETISLAISASETGHLVFGTLHTTNAPGTIDRIINAFPAGQQGQIRAMISDSLKAVVSQTLLPRRGGKGRVAAFEILRGVQSVSALIRESKTYQLGSTLQTGSMAGMNTMDQALMKLVEDGKIDVEAALDKAVKKDPFEKLLAEERQAFA